MAQRAREAEALARLLEQTSRSLHSLGYDSGLFPAQWTALRYLARGEAGHRTASSLARFQGIAVGPVTRTVRTLVSKGLLRTVSIGGRGGAKQLEVTPEGQAVLDRDPLRLVVDAMATFSPEERAVLATALERVLGQIHARSRAEPAA